MNNDTLRRVQLTQLEMAREIKRVCGLLDIPYHLDSGSLLGAVRHKGFIPWDDDLDIGMTRLNYERFINEAPSVLSDNYTLQTWHNDLNYGLPFAKLRKKGTIYMEETSESSGAETGFYIDIFPYNAYPDQKKQRKKQGLKYDLYRRLILVKCNYSPWRASGSTDVVKRVLYSLAKILVVFISKEHLIKKYERTCTEYEANHTEYVFPSGTSNYGKWVIKRNCIEDLIELQFEDDYFLCPNDFDAYLRAAYGDYMKLPPEDKRENRHRIIKIDFGNSI